MRNCGEKRLLTQSADEPDNCFWRKFDRSNFLKLVMKFTKMKQLVLNMGPMWRKIPRPIMLNSTRNLHQMRHLHKGSSIHLELSPEVRSALANNEPVVALESTIITHGMPFPRNYETAVKVENICRLKVRKSLTILCR
jgi:hypothetical protein